MTQAYKEAVDNKVEQVKAGKVLSKGRSFVDKETGHELPARVLYLSKKLTFQKSMLWYLQNFQNMSLEELTEYQKAYSKELSIIETEVIELLLKARAGSSDAKGMLYDANKTLFNASKSVFIEELRAQQKAPEQNKLDALLEKIGEAIVGE